ncbi:amicyanin [Devosia albogilva]|uniref:Amicyanin n=1 Tax=Devosia albogilva TaxID=429726 RepID=A0ABW5QFU7_9HYPH
MSSGRLLPALLAGLVLLTSPALAEEYVIVIDAMKFAAPPDGLKENDVIVWRNEDIFRHTATDRGGSFDMDLEPGAEARLTLAAAGTFEVYCRYHPGMTLDLVVEP